MNERPDHPAAGTPGVVVEPAGDHVALVELRRPPHNYLDVSVLAALADRLHGLAARSECRAVVLAAAGRSFCAGANFAAGGVGGEPGDVDFRAQTSAFYGEAVRVFEAPLPIVAAIHGPAVGGGLGLALACDLRVVCPETWMAANFVKLGIHAGFGISATLPALLGPARAADLLLTGRRVAGEEAIAIGLADRLVAAEEVRPAALALADEIAAAAPLAVASTRATLRAGLADRVRRVLERELEEQARLFATADAAEGIASSLERREPQFSRR
jgi:enoyl-CoA hydratase/carnithine racemase